MGAKQTKEEQLNALSNVSQKSQSYNPKQPRIFDWPSQELREKIPNSQIQFNQQERSPINGSTLEQFNNSIEEDAQRNSTNQQQLRVGSLSKLQKNKLPQIQKRILESKLVLCKIPLKTKDNQSSQSNIAPHNNFVEGYDLSPRSSRLHQQSKQSELSPLQSQIPLASKTSFNKIIDGNRKDMDQKSKYNNKFGNKPKQSLFVKIGSSDYERKSMTSTSSKFAQRPTNSQLTSRNNRAKLQKPTSQVLDQSDMSQSVADQISSQKIAISRIVNKHVKQSQYNSPQIKRKDVLKSSSVFEMQEDYKQSSTARQIRSTVKHSQALGGTTRASQSKMYNMRRDSSNARLDTRDTIGLEYDIKLKQSQMISRQKTATKYSNNQIAFQQMKSVELPQNYIENDTVQETNQIYEQQYKEISFPLKIVMLILQYNIDEFPKLQRISASWHTVINDALDEYSIKIENSFVIANSKALNFIKSYNNATPITFCNQKGMRMDRIFECEVVDCSQILNHTLMIACESSYLKTNNNSISKQQPQQRYRTEYMFDVIKRGSQRVTWIHLSDELPPYGQNEIQMSPGDIIEFAVCLYNMNGLVDLDTFQWENISMFKIQKNERDALIYNRDLKILKHKNDRKTKVHCNTNRICEVEDAVPEWITIGKDQRDQPKIEISTLKYASRFNVLSVQFNELDQHYNKIVLQALRSGVVEPNAFGENLIVRVQREGFQIMNEIKKRGVMFDRNNGKARIQLRVGDILVVYNSITIPHELQPDIVFPESSYNSRVSSAYNTNQTIKEDNHKADTNPN